MNNTAIIDRKRRIQISSRFRANEWFKHYNKEKESEAKTLIIKKDPVLERLKVIYEKAYTEVLAAHTDIPDVQKSRDCIEPLYNKSIEMTKRLNYSAKDVTNFVLAIPEYKQDRMLFFLSGIFVSALINNCKDDGFMIPDCFDEKRPSFGYRNMKNVTIKGDAYIENKVKSGTIVIEGNAISSTGSYMVGGTIIVKGNAGYCIGQSMKGGTIIIEGNDPDLELGVYMEGGKIIIKGNVGKAAGNQMSGGEILIMGKSGNELGAYMYGGKITVNGNTGVRVGESMEKGEIIVNGDAGSKVGEGMTGGTIHLNGNYKSLGKINGGNIYHKGKLIYKDGKRL